MANTSNLGDLYLAMDEFGNGDLVFLPDDIACDSGMQTGVYISLFTDAEDTDNRTTQHGGFWGDAIDDYGALGSRLWTLSREKMSAGITTLAQVYCQEALQWMLDCGAAKSVVVTVKRTGLYSLGIEIDITQPDSSSGIFAYSYNWSCQDDEIKK